MAVETLTLRDLRVQTLKERKQGMLTKIPNNFFEQLKKLESQIRDVIEQSKDNLKRLEKSNSDMRKLLDLKLELHKLRERKLTDLAREKVNGQSPNSENVHATESEYLDSICSVIEKHRESNLLNSGYDLVPEVEQDRSKEAVAEKNGKVEIEKKIYSQPIKETKTENEKLTNNSEYLEVKVLEDLPTFTGMDARNYTLKSGDMKSIPKYNARMLSDAGKVKLVTEVKV